MFFEDGENFSVGQNTTLIINDNLIIEKNAVLNGADRAKIRVSGNWDNQGTFNHNNIAVYFTGSGESIISGKNTFHTFIADFTESDTSAGKALKFEANKAQTITDTFRVKGSGTDDIFITSTIDGKTATLELADATPDAADVNVKDSIASGVKNEINPLGSVDSGNTTMWFLDETMTITYNYSSNKLKFNGTNMYSVNGADNDITVGALTLTGERGATYTLIDTPNVEITSTGFTLILGAADRVAVNFLLNKNGTSSADNTIYNMAGATGWNGVKSDPFAVCAILVSNIGKDTLSPIVEDDVEALDDKAKDAVKTLDSLLKKLIAKKDATKPGEGYSIFEDLDLTDDVRITSGHPAELGSRDGWLQIDSDESSIEAYISTDGDTIPEFVWNPTNRNTLEKVNLYIVKIKDLTGIFEDITSLTGYPKGYAKAKDNISNRPALSGKSDDPNHDFKVYGYSGGKLVPVTGTLTTNATGQWNITKDDYIKSFDFGENIIILKGSVSLPVPISVNEDITITKVANRKEVFIGSIVTYTIAMENKSGSTLNDITIIDDLPPGFKYVEGSARWDNDGDTGTPMIAITPTKIGNSDGLYFFIDTIPYDSKIYNLRYQLRVGTGVNYGTYTNTAVAIDNNGTTAMYDDHAISKRKSAHVDVVPDAFFDLSIIIGKVFNDRNGNGRQDEGDLPVPHVKLVTSAGQQITVDSDGQYHMADVPPGRMVIRIDERSLPTGSKIIGHHSLIVETRPGIPVRANFAVQLPDNYEVADRRQMLIEQLSGRPVPRLNLAVFGTPVLDRSGDRFCKPLEIRLYSNFPTFIKEWEVTVREDFSNRIIKQFNGSGTTLFVPVFWDNMTSLNPAVNPKHNYTIRLTVKDSYGRKATTVKQKFTINKWTLKQENALRKHDGKALKRDHARWLRQLSVGNAIDKNWIRIKGKTVLITGDEFDFIRIVRDGKTLLEIPHYNRGKREALDLLKHGGMDEPSSTTEMILPRGRIRIEAVRKDSIDSKSVAPHTSWFKVEPKSWLSKLFDLIIPPAYGGTLDKAPVHHDTKEKTAVTGQTIMGTINSTTKGYDTYKTGFVVTESQNINVGGIEGMDKTKIFLVGIIDGELGYRGVSSNLELAESGDNRFKKYIWKDGKVQLYLKGIIKGDYLITASFDSERGSEDLFRNLNPNVGYAVYGDSSSVTDLANESDGMLYLLIEKDESWAKWGQISTGLNNTHLASFERTVQGRQVHYESLDSTAYGEAKTVIDVFDARTSKKSAHNEFLSTGGSLYYLKHHDIEYDSLQLKIEVRDRINGNVNSTRKLKSGTDYKFDSNAGRITFWKPMERYVNSGLLISSGTNNGDLVYLVADYNYNIANDWKKGITGGRVRQAIIDELSVGATLFEEDQSGSYYKIKGVDATVRLSENHTVNIEYAKSESRAEPKYISTDGGLIWGIETNDISSADKDRKGTAISISGNATTEDKKVNLNYYYHKIDSDFSSNVSTHQQGQKAFGANIVYQVSEQLSLRLQHDTQKQLYSGSDQVNNQIGAKETHATTAQASYNLNDRLTITGELLHVNAVDIDSTNQAEVNYDRDVVAVQGRYLYDADTEVTLQNQLALKGETNNRISAKIRRHITKQLDLRAKATTGNQGTSFGVGTDYAFDKKLSISGDVEQSSAGNTTSRVGGNYSPQEDTSYNLSLTDERGSGNVSQSVALGNTHKLNEKTSLASDISFALSGKSKRNSLGSKITHNIGDGRSVHGSFTRYMATDDTENSDGYEIGLGGDISQNLALSLTTGNGYVHRLDGGKDRRFNIAIGTTYIHRDDDGKELLMLRSRYEKRRDRGQDNRNQYLANMDIKGKYNQDITLFTEFDWSRTKNHDTDEIDASNNRFDLGFAYRPVMNDRLNLLGKYSWVNEKRPDNQVGITGIEKQKGHIFATDILWDFNKDWSIGGKFALRYGVEKIEDMPWATSTTLLTAARIKYNFIPDTWLSLELRHLENIQADDNKDGLVLEIGRRFNENFELAIGFNWAGYNDDLAALDYDISGIYMRITSVLF